jgi:EAL domain-containing protein (putative c-di-GMP-specific phosphodiesterase class I)
LGVETVAVFVGDEETLQILEAERVDYAQGFFVGSPAPIAMSLDEIVDRAARQQAVIVG